MMDRNGGRCSRCTWPSHAPRQLLSQSRQRPLCCMRHKLPPKPRPPRQSCCRGHGSGHCMRRSSCVVAAATAATARAGAAAATATAAAVACGHGSCAIGGGSNCTRAETAAPTATAAAVACSSVRQVGPRNRRVMQRLAPREPPCMLAHDSHLRAPRAPPAGEYTRIPLSLCPSRSRPAPRARLYSVRHGTFPAAKEALGLQPAASAVSQGSSSVRCREGVEGIARLGSRAAAQQQPMRFAALHRAQ